MTTSATSEVSVCQICGAPVLKAEATRGCEECHSLYHEPCWEFIGGCATYGCPRMYETKKAEDGPVVFWGAEEKTCPMCAEKILVSDTTCPHCKTEFQDVKPVSREDVLRREDEPPDPLRKKAFRMLILSALGLPSPFILFGGSIWYYSHRRELAEGNATTRALVLIAIAVSALYLILVGLGIAAFRFSNQASGGVP